jgi:hypothetical protein
MNPIDRRSMLGLMGALPVVGTPSPSARDFKTGGTSRGHANRWGGRTLLSTDQTISARKVAVLLDTEMLDRPYLWRIDFLFSQPTTGATPTPREFTPLAVAPTKIIVRHGVDNRQGTVDDVYNLNPAAAVPPGGSGVITPVWMPLSYARSRKLTIIVEVSAFTDGHGNLYNSSWVDVCATPIDAVDTEQIVSSRANRNIFGFGGTFSARVASSTTAPGVPLLAASAARRKFWIVNKSTANLYVAFGDVVDLTPGSESFTIEIPAGGTYESPLDQYWGDVTGLWDAVNGYAMVTESDLFA